MLRKIATRKSIEIRLRQRASGLAGAVSAVHSPDDIAKTVVAASESLGTV